jgi:sensor histidine kinase regulating citrate/malate metabolism
MGQVRKTRQTGISFFGLLFVIVVLVSVGLLGAQAFPTVLEYQAALKAVNKAAAGNTVPEVRTIFDKAAQIDDIRSITGKDLAITKNGDKVVVSFAYDKEIHMFGPAYLLLKYQGQSR